MGFFGKEKITFDQLASGLADMVLRSISDAQLEPYRILLKSMKEEDVIDEGQKREILVLEMLAATRAVSVVFSDSNISKEILDEFHAKIYDKVCQSNKEQIDFEKFVNNRYRTYYEILGSGSENMMFFFGKQFVDYFLKKDLKGASLALITSSAEFFASNTKTLVEFLKSVTEKFELKR